MKLAKTNPLARINAMAAREEAAVLPMRRALEPLLTAADVGHLLRVPPKKVYALLGDIATRLGPRRLRWHPEAVANYVARHTPSSAGGPR